MPDTETTYTPYAERPQNGGEQRLYRFANGYEASVIRGPYSYGGPEGLFELAVMVNGHCHYDTPVTNDVEGWLTEADVQRLLAEIDALPSRSEGS